MKRELELPEGSPRLKLRMARGQKEIRQKEECRLGHLSLEEIVAFGPETSVAIL